MRDGWTPCAAGKPGATTAQNHLPEEPGLPKFAAGCCSPCLLQGRFEYFSQEKLMCDTGFLHGEDGVHLEGVAEVQVPQSDLKLHIDIGALGYLLLFFLTAPKAKAAETPKGASASPEEPAACMPWLAGVSGICVQSCSSKGVHNFELSMQACAPQMWCSCINMPRACPCHSKICIWGEG